MTGTKDRLARTHGIFQMAVRGTFEPLIDDMVGRFSRGLIDDIAHLIDPRFGLMGRDMYLLTARDRHDGNDTHESTLADEAYLIGQNEIGSLSSSGLEQEKRNREHVRTVIACLRTNCIFVPSTLRDENAKVWTCAVHQVMHICRHDEECAAIVELTSLFDIDVSRVVCAVSRKKILDEEFLFPGGGGSGNAKCIITNGLQQKHREALIYDSDRNVSQNWMVMSKGISKLDIMRSYVRKIILQFIDVSVRFQVFIGSRDFADIYYSDENRVDMQDDTSCIVKRRKTGKLGCLLDYAWWTIEYRNASIVDFGTDKYCKALFTKCMASLKLFIAAAHSDEFTSFVTTFKKIDKKKDSEVAIHHLMMVPLLCTVNILQLTGEYIDGTRLTKIFFKRKGGFNQATYTAMDKLIHSTNGMTTSASFNYKFGELLMYVNCLIGAIQEICENDSATWSTEQV